MKLRTSMLVLAGLLFATTALAETYQVPRNVIRSASQVLGTPLIATQRVFREDAIQIMQEGGTQFVRFTIRHGDIGGAPTDNDTEHSRIFNRPWSERVELRTRDEMRRNSVYEITFRARMAQGFRNRAETIFQLHTGRKPPLMFFFRDFGSTEWTARILEGCAVTCDWNDDPEMIPFQWQVPRSQSMGRWHDYRIILDTGATPTISIWINDRALVSQEPVTLPSQHRPYVRLGVYRPGDRSGNATSVLDYAMLEIRRLGRSPD